MTHGEARAPLRYAFGEFILDVATRSLTRSGEPVALGSRACELLIALVEQRDRVVGRDELIRSAWGDGVVERNSLPVAIFALRQAFGNQFCIRNVYGRGYQFVLAVTVLDPMSELPQPGTAPSLARSERPSVVVLPFTVSVGSDHDALGEVMGDGLAEELIGALSRNRWLRVVARNSTFSFRDGGTSLGEIARRLGARYVLEGSVRRAGDRVRVTAQLNDAVSDTLLVSERYERVVTEIFAMQDEITSRIVEAVRPVLVEAEQNRSFRTPPESIDAWTAYQRGVWFLGRWSDADLQLSLDWFRRAMELDPRYAPGHYGAARLLCRAGSGYSPVAPADWREQAEALSQEAIKLDGRDSGARVALGWTRYMRGELDGAMEAAREAVELNPSDAAGFALMGAAMVFNGKPADGIETLQASIDLDPNDPRVRVRQMQIGLGLYFQDDLAAAEDLAGAMLRVWPDYDGAHRLMGMVLAETGRHGPALAALERARAISPAPFDNFSHARMPWYRPGAFRRVLSAWRRAGWQGPGDPL